MGSQKFDLLVSRLMDLAQQPELLLLIAIAVPLILYCSVSPKYRWWVIALWVFFLPITPVFDWKGVWVAPPFPFNKIVFHGRQISLFLLIILIPAAFKFRGQNRDAKVPPALFGLLIMNMVYCIRYLPTDHLEIALTRLFSFLAVFYVLALSFPHWVSDRRDIYRYLKASATGLLLLIFASLICYVMRPSSVTPGGRFSGLTSNANYLGAICGYAMPALLGLSLSPALKIKNRYFWLLAAAFVLLILVWTGSRTSLGMCGIGIIVIFRAKLGRFLIAGIPLALFVWLLSYFFQDAQSGAEHLTSLKNTRIEAWTYYYQMWQKDLIFGNADLGMKVVENSYLALASNAGIAGCAAILVFLFLTAKTCLQLVRLRTNDREVEILRDIALAGIAAALGNSVFEATLLSSLSTNMFWIFLYFTLADIVINRIAYDPYGNWYLASQPPYQMLPGQYGLGVPRYGS